MFLVCLFIIKLLARKDMFKYIYKELNISKNRVFIFSTNTILDIKINLDLHIIDS